MQQHCRPAAGTTESGGGTQVGNQAQLPFNTSQSSRYIPTGITLSDLPAQSQRGGYGAWAMADQMIERDAADPNRGSRPVEQLCLGDPRTAAFSYFGSVGVARKGTFDTRQ